VVRMHGSHKYSEHFCPIVPAVIIKITA